MFGFNKKDKDNEKEKNENKKDKSKKLPVKEVKEVIFERYTNQGVGYRPVKVFTGSVNDCVQFVRAQAIEAKQMISQFEDEVILRVYRSKNWSRIEVLDIVGDENEAVSYYSSTYRII